MKDLQGGRKHTTRVQGLEIYGLEPGKFAQKCQILFACAGGTQPMPGKSGKAEEVRNETHKSPIPKSIFPVHPMWVPIRLFQPTSLTSRMDQETDTILTYAHDCRQVCEEDSTVKNPVHSPGTLSALYCTFSPISLILVKSARSLFTQFPNNHDPKKIIDCVSSSFPSIALLRSEKHHRSQQKIDENNGLSRRRHPYRGSSHQISSPIFFSSLLPRHLKPSILQRLTFFSLKKSGQLHPIANHTVIQAFHLIRSHHHEC